jgi:hypothetical protein
MRRKVRVIMQTSPTQTRSEIVQKFAIEIETAIQSEARRMAEAALRQAFGPEAPKGNGHNKAAARITTLRSAKQHAQNVLQGRYIGNLRSLSAGDKKKVKVERAKNGLRQAVALATKLKAA